MSENKLKSMPTLYFQFFIYFVLFDFTDHYITQNCCDGQRAAVILQFPFTFHHIFCQLLTLLALLTLLLPYTRNCNFLMY